MHQKLLTMKKKNLDTLGMMESNVVNKVQIVKHVYGFGSSYALYFGNAPTSLGHYLIENIVNTQQGFNVVPN
jgi:hypothetical protein